MKSNPRVIDVSMPGKGSNALVTGDLVSGRPSVDALNPLTERELFDVLASL